MRAIWILGLMVSGVLAQEVAPPEEVTSIVSRSKQFRVSGGDALTRGVSAILAEQCKDDLQALLVESDAWKVPVSIVLHGKPGDEAPRRTIAERLTRIEGMPCLELHKHLGPGLEVGAFRDAVTAVLIHERALRSVAGESDELVQVPLWLTQGLQEASDWRKQQGQRALYASVFKRGGLVALNDLLDMTDERLAKEDLALREAFRVSAGAMVMALLEQPEGKQAFRGFLDKVTRFQGEMPVLLRECFPDLNLSANSLAKWWALQLAAKGDMLPLTEVLDIPSTEEQMAKALFLQISDAEGKVQRVGLDEWQRLAGLSAAQRAMAVRPAQMALLHLNFRCFPAYRPLIVEYQKLLVKMLQDDATGIDPLLGELQGARETLVARALRGRDLLDWFEITCARETSGVFDDYLKLKQELKERKPDRKDGISTYLDRMNQAFERDE